jgi:hypothetical protein
MMLDRTELLVVAAAAILIAFVIWFFRPGRK